MSDEQDNVGQASRLSAARRAPQAPERRGTPCAAFGRQARRLSYVVEVRGSVDDMMELIYAGVALHDLGECSVAFEPHGKGIRAPSAFRYIFRAPHWS